MNLIENEDLAWERFEKAVSSEDIAACYDMSLKDFEHSGVHDLFKVCVFVFASSLSLYAFLKFFFFFLVNVKGHRSIQASHGVGQDEDLA